MTDEGPEPSRAEESAGDQPASPPAETAPPANDPAAAGEPPRSSEDTALLSSLISAMRDVADRERSSKVATLRTAVDEAIDRMKARAAEEANQLRERADLDIAGIADWVKSETERIEAEGRSKTEARRSQLSEQLADHDQRAERAVSVVRSRFEDYETQLSTFFAELDAISDPAVFGTAAKRMPRPPELDVPAEAPAPAGSAPDVEAASPVVPPTASAPEEAETPAQEPAEATATETEPDTAPVEAATGVNPADEAAEGSVETPQAAPATPTTETLRDRMDALGISREGAPVTAEADSSTKPAEVGEPGSGVSDATGLAARLAQLDARLGAPGESSSEVTTVPSPGPTGETATAIMVSGLGSFGAITSFKQALERADGIHGISLSLGPTGEFVYRATHATDFDLAAAIEQIERGTAKVDRQADGSLRVTVQRTR